MISHNYPTTKDDNPLGSFSTITMQQLQQWQSYHGPRHRWRRFQPSSACDPSQKAAPERWPQATQVPLRCPKWVFYIWFSTCPGDSPNSSPYDSLEINNSAQMHSFLLGKIAIQPVICRHLRLLVILNVPCAFKRHWAWKESKPCSFAACRCHLAYRNHPRTCCMHAECLGDAHNRTICK